MRCTAYKVARDDGLIQSETCRASNEKMKSNHKNFMHVVGLYTYCRMMQVHTASNGNFKFYFCAVFGNTALTLRRPNYMTTSLSNYGKNGKKKMLSM